MKLFLKLKQMRIARQVIGLLKSYGLPELSKSRDDYDDAVQLITNLRLYPVDSQDYTDALDAAADYVGIDDQEANDETEYQF